MAKKKKRKLVEVIWLDPSENKMKVEDLKKVLESEREACPLKQFLIKTTCYGVIMVEDDETILLKYYENEVGDREWKTIPKILIQKITPYYSGKPYSRYPINNQI